MRDDFSRDTKLVLAQRAAMVCSNPHCGTTTSGPQEDPTKSLNIGVAAHITAASPGGIRYAETLTNEERSASTNGIWLCQNCAKLVDNDASAYPVEILRAWKTIREHEALKNIGQIRQLTHDTEAQRKVRELLKWKGKTVLLVKTASGHQAMVSGTTRPWASIGATLLDCNEFYVQLRGDGGGWDKSIPMGQVQLGWDNSRNLLEILAEF
jgi:hypothetical protein